MKRLQFNLRMTEETMCILDLMSTLSKTDKSKYIMQLLYQDYTKNKYNVLKKFTSTPEEYEAYLEEQKETKLRAEKIFNGFSDQNNTKAVTPE